jgi:hypothetical protein
MIRSWTRLRVLHTQLKFVIFSKGIMSEPVSAALARLIQGFSDQWLNANSC